MLFDPIFKFARFEEEEEAGSDFYEYQEDGGDDQKIRNIRKNDAIFR